MCIKTASDLSIYEALQKNNLLSTWLMPFLKGVFLDKQLTAPFSRFLQLFPYFITGNACLPKQGMQALPAWYAARLKKTEIRLHSTVKEVHYNKVRLSDGQKIECQAVILALSLPELSKLLPSIPAVTSCASCCDYFAIEDQKSFFKPLLYLDGRENSPLNNFSILSSVQPSYAPQGMHLVSATSLGPNVPSQEIVKKYICNELKLTTLHPIKRYVIQHSLPLQQEQPFLPSRIIEGCFIAGEAVDPPSINDALASGKKTALAMHHTFIPIL
jgi:hypothetical protein